MSDQEWELLTDSQYLRLLADKLELAFDTTDQVKRLRVIADRYRAMDDHIHS